MLNIASIWSSFHDLTKSSLATRSYQQNRQTSAMSRKCKVHVTSVSGPVAVDRKAARASVQRGKPQKPMDAVSLYITSKCCGTHTLSSPHPHPHTQVCADKLTKKDQCWHTTLFLYSLRLKDREKRTQENGKVSSSPSGKKDFHFSQILSGNL